MFAFMPDILSAILSIKNILFMSFGVLAGIVVGALPGLTTTMALALLLPFTFSMEANTALMTLGGLYIGGIYGGSISAILINTPGTPSAIATTFDGYPLAKKGKSTEALMTAAFSSGIGGMLGGLALLFLTPMLAEMALKFGPPEYFWIAMLGLTMIATLSSGTLLKGLIGGSLGLLLSTVGISPIGGESRYTFGFSQLQAGFELVVLLIAFFCIPEVINMTKSQLKRDVKKEQADQPVQLFRLILTILKKPILLLRSAVIGIITGIVPGAGGNIAGLLAYDSAVRFAGEKEKQKFGKGHIDGVVASETSNNAEVGGSLVPLLSLGIPGAPPAAIILGALMMHGVQPGPHLLTEHGGLVYTFLVAFMIANVIMLIFGIFGSKYVGQVLRLPVHYLAPLILFLTMIGAFALRNNLLDVLLVILFGIIAYGMKQLGFQPAPIVLGLILGPIAENGLAQTMLMGQAQGSIAAVFFTRPVSIVLIVLCLLSLCGPMLSKWMKKRRGGMA